MYIHFHAIRPLISNLEKAFEKFVGLQGLRERKTEIVPEELQAKMLICHTCVGERKANDAREQS